jgi:CubicO group peptidase (beta-lactamase class C family)
MLEKTKAYLHQQVDERKLPGYVLAVTNKDKILFEEAYGYRQIVPEPLPMQTDTLFDLASLSKVVSTTSVLLQLLEREEIHLDTRVCELDPKFIHKDVTLLHLMSHTSGLPADDKRYKACQSKEELLSFMHSLPLMYPTGSDCVYSDFGYMELGHLIEIITHQSLDEYTYKNLFAPLHMDHTGYKPKDVSNCIATEYDPLRGMISGVVHDGKGYRMNQVSGHAGLFSTAADLALFVQNLLSDEKEILPNKHLLHTCYTKKTPLSRTLGWICGQPEPALGNKVSNSFLYHTGFTGQSLYIDFEREIGVILLTNAVHPLRMGNHIKEIRPGFFDRILAEIDQA